MNPLINLEKDVDRYLSMKGIIDAFIVLRDNLDKIVEVYNNEKIIYYLKLGDNYSLNDDISLMEKQIIIGIGGDVFRYEVDVVKNYHKYLFRQKKLNRII